MIVPYKNLVKTIASGIKRVFFENQHAEQVLEKILSGDKRLGARDRRFIAEHFYNLVRYWRHSEELKARQEIHPENDPFLLTCLWLAHVGFDLSQWPETQHWNSEKLKQPITGQSAISLSVPDWLWELGWEELGERWPLELTSLNESAPIYLRANQLKTNPAELIEILKQEGVDAELVKNHPFALKLANRTNVIRLGSFRKGLYEVQDAASQMVAPFLEAEPGMTVIDACAGAGGKTLHLAGLMQDSGKLIAMDIEGWKLEEVKKRASRAGIKMVQTEVIRNAKTIKFWTQKADRLLLDAPCTGLGVLRRHPDSKWKLTPDSYDAVRETQAEILDQYCKMVKPGGKMVYATCSLMPGENEKQVEQFLEESPDFQLEESYRTWPSEGWDGFFMARFVRNS